MILNSCGAPSGFIRDNVYIITIITECTDSSIIFQLIILIMNCYSEIIDLNKRDNES